ncbi:hypothetical protein ACFYTQ_22040 [Nocardia sp. NPDC004068]|uniref:hypothetical protein n=1 Tax=Nocardia sp. NPDC004068 TaxID=3364303 RepID=UPI00369498B3
MTEAVDIGKIHDLAAVVRQATPATDMTSREIYETTASLLAVVSALSDLVAETARRTAELVPTGDDSHLTLAESQLRQAAGHIMAFRWELGRAVGADVKIQRIGDHGPRGVEPTD